MMNERTYKERLHPPVHMDACEEESFGDRMYRHLYEVNKELVEALEMMVIGACACGIPHEGERAVLAKAVIHARAAIAKARGDV